MKWFGILPIVVGIHVVKFSGARKLHILDSLLKPRLLFLRRLLSVTARRLSYTRMYISGALHYKKYAATVPFSKLSMFYFSSYIIIIFFIKSNFRLKYIYISKYILQYNNYNMTIIMTIIFDIREFLQYRLSRYDER